jgi:hypothetical protein
MAMLLMFEGGAAAGTVDLMASLEHYWKLDQVGSALRVDSVALGSNDLAVVGTPVSAAVVGKIGNAFDTNTASAYLQGANVNLAARPFTIAGWVQVYGLDHTQSDSAPVFSAGDGGLSTCECSFRWSVGTASSGWCFEWGPQITNHKIQIPSTPYGTGWNFFCVRYDTATMRLRVNTMNTTQAEPVGPSYYFKPFWVGLLQYSSISYRADLRVDELGIWGRSLSDAEVSTLYAGWTP